MREGQPAGISTEDKPTRGRILISCLGGVAAGVAATFLFMQYADKSQIYGIGSFCLIPFFVGLVAALSLGPKRPPTMGQAIGIAGYCFLIGALLVVIFAFEGIICVLMAAPIVLPSCLLGAMAGIGFLNASRGRFRSGRTLAAAPLVPLALCVVAHQTPSAEVRVETTEIVIHASAKKIWPLLLNLNRIEGPVWWMFSAGIAHPDQIKTIDPRVGASRQCILSTGVMPEKISVLEPEKRLQFDVLRTPPTMKEFNPFHEIHPAHLEDYFNCEVGEFRVVPRADGSTLLVGTSRYNFRLYPAPYWAMWTDTVVEQVHLRVMREVKRRSEEHPTDFGVQR